MPDEFIVKRIQRLVEPLARNSVQCFMSAGRQTTQSERNTNVRYSFHFGRLALTSRLAGSQGP
jgi:hypothetical protein